MEDEKIQKYLAEFGQYFFKINRFANRMITNEDISRQQYLLMRTLYERQKSTVTELAEVLGLSSSATTISINRLVKNGYIARSRDEQDRRVVWVELTEHAIEQMKTLIEERNKLLIQLLSPLSMEEIETFLALNRKMAEHLE